MLPFADLLDDILLKKYYKAVEAKGINDDLYDILKAMGNDIEEDWIKYGGGKERFGRLSEVIVKWWNNLKDDEKESFFERIGWGIWTSKLFGREDVGLTAERLVKVRNDRGKQMLKLFGCSYDGVLSVTCAIGSSQDWSNW